MPRLAYTAARADPDITAAARVVDPAPERTITVSSKESLLNNPAVARLLELLRLHASASLTPAA